MDLNGLVQLVQTNYMIFIALILLFIVIAISYAGSWMLVDLIKLFFKKIVGKFLSLFGKKKEIKYAEDDLFDDNTVNLFNFINEELAVLRAELDADRAFVTEFHNGQFFASKAPRWKASKTWEKVRSGVSFEAFNMQNLEVTLHWNDYIKTLYSKDREKLPLGFSIIRKNPECKHLNLCSTPRRTYLLTVAEMDKNLGPTRTLLERQHVYYQLLSPIIDNDLNIIGCVGVDYCNEDDLTEIINDDEYSPCKICQFASILSSMWIEDLERKNTMMIKQQDFWYSLHRLRAIRK